MAQRIYADFNAMTDDGRVVLDTVGSLADIKNIQKTLQVGSKVTLYMPNEFEVDATLEYDTCNLVWLGLPDWTTIQYVREESERIQAIAAIKAVFANVSREDGVTLHEARVIDDWGSETEKLKARELDSDTEWRHVPDKDIAEYSECLNYCDPKAFRYYVPAFMIWTLNNVGHSKSNSVDTTIYALSLRKKWGRDTSSLERKFSILNDEQSRAVCKFLKYMVQQGCDSDSAKEALADYWTKFD